MALIIQVPRRGEKELPKVPGRKVLSRPGRTPVQVVAVRVHSVVSFHVFVVQYVAATRASVFVLGVSSILVCVVESVGSTLASVRLMRRLRPSWSS